MSTSSLDPDVDVVVDHDPTTWLRGPDVDSPVELRERWAHEAARTYDEAFDLGSLEQAGQVRDHLRRLFDHFSAWETPAQMRFLRLREPTDTAIPVGMEFYGPSQLADLGLGPGDDVLAAVMEIAEDRTVVGETSVEDVAEAPGWRRLFYSVAGVDDRIYSFVRYARVFDPGVLVVLRFGGDSPAVALEAISDADALAASVTVTPRGGR